MKKLLIILLSFSIAMVMGGFISLELTLNPLMVGGALFLLGFALKAQKNMAMMAIVYPTDCDEELVHSCDECDDPELARVRGVALIKNSYTFSDPTSYSEWLAAITSGDVVIIPMTRGTFDGGTVKEGTGYGDQATKYMSTDYSLTYFDPNYKANRDFYNSLKRFQNYRIAYKTETLVHLTDKPAQFLPKAPVADDITQEVVWEVNAKWSSQNEPTPYLCPDGIFVCFEIEAEE